MSHRPISRGLASAIVIAIATATLVLAVLVGRARAADGAAPALSAAPATAPAPLERAVESRLLAPCCWTQTLDIHESEIATELRAEVHERLTHGDRPEAIEDDFAARFGERIRALPKGRDPLKTVPLFVGAAMLVSAIALGLMLRRWTRATAPAPVVTAGPSAAAHDDYDDRLDEELRWDDRA